MREFVITLAKTILLEVSIVNQQLTTMEEDLQMRYINTPEYSLLGTKNL